MSEGTPEAEWYSLAIKSIKAHEGWEPMPYQDHLGNWTVGCGHKLPLTDDDIGMLLNADIVEAMRAAAYQVKSFGTLEHARQAVLVEMAFQLGWGGFASFVKFIDAVGRRDFVEAKAQMLDSKWAKQTPGRVQELAEIMERGE